LKLHRRSVYHDFVNFSIPISRPFGLLSQIIRSALTLVPLGLTVRIIAVPLSAGVAHEVATAGHAGQNETGRIYVSGSVSAGGATSAPSGQRQTNRYQIRTDTK